MFVHPVTAGRSLADLIKRRTENIDSPSCVLFFKKRAMLLLF